MKVAFQDIVKGATARSVSGDFWTSDLPYEFGRTPDARLVFGVMGEETVSVEGNLKAGVVTVCARCGNEIHYPIDVDFTYIVALGRDTTLQEKEREYTDEDSLTVFVQEPLIDVDEILKEQLILAVPEKLLCNEECKGLCYKCGANLNDEVCRCREDAGDSPFAVLEKLKK